MDNKNSLQSDNEFIRCQFIWFLFLTELNWDPDAINPLEIVLDSFCSELTDLLIKSRFIGQTKEYYLRESDKYMNYLSKGGKPFSSLGI